MRRTLVVFIAAGALLPQAPASSRVNPTDGLTYVWIPPGSFTMGCSAGDNDCYTSSAFDDDRERPAHRVTISRGFWMGQTTVTVGAWKRYTSRSGKVMPPAPEENPRWADDRMPMVMIVWDEASEFCVAAGGRLPTEAEWEYAARAGTAAARYGDLDAIAWYADNSGRKRIDSVALINRKRRPIYWDDNQDFYDALKANHNSMKPVGLKQPNAWNLYDMLGNVWQLTADWFDKRYYQNYQNKVALDPQGPPGDTAGELRKRPEERRYKTARGGAWDGLPAEVRVSNRGNFIPFAYTPANRRSDFGVRCVSN